MCMRSVYFVTIVLVIILLNINFAISDENASNNGTIGICYSQAPNILTNCQSSIYENETLICMFFSNKINVTFNSTFDDYTVFNVSSNGGVYKEFTPLDIGNHTYNVTANDNSGCTSGIYSTNYSLEILSRGNHPPHQVMPLENKSMILGSTLNSFILDLYFDDVDGDELNYTASCFSGNIGTSIDASSRITFTSVGAAGLYPCWVTAYDPYNASVLSNTFWIVVYQLNIPPPSSSSSSSNTKSKSSTKSYIPFEFEKLDLNQTINGSFVSCYPDWNCSEWSACFPQGFAFRECIDLKNCNSSIFKPNITQPCTYEPTCFDGIKNGLEEGVDCGGFCETECIIETCFDGKKNQGEEGIDCGGPCDLSCKSIKNETKLKDVADIPKTDSNRNFMGYFLFMLIALISLSVLYKLYTVIIPKVILRFKQSLMLTKEQYRNFMDELEKIEKNVYYMDTVDSLSKLSNTIGDFIRILLSIDKYLTHDELIDMLQEYDDPRFKVIYNFFKGLNVDQYSNQAVNKTKVLSFIYQAKTIMLLTKPKDYKLHKFVLKTKLNLKTNADLLFAQIVKVNFKILNDELDDSKRLYSQVLIKIKEINDESLKNELIPLLKTIKSVMDLFPKNEDK